MTHSPETRHSLVIRLTSARDEVAWAEFLSLYEPLILRLMRKKGLQDSDARDVCQQVLVAVASDVGKWKPDGFPASFRRWLFQIARNTALKFLVKARLGAKSVGGTDAQIQLSEYPDPQACSAEEFDGEYRRQLLIWGAEQIRGEFHETTWQAFWESCVGGIAVAEVADALGTTAGNVYVARSRIIARLRAKISEVHNDSL